MLESLLIVSHGGLVLYQYHANVVEGGSPAHSIQSFNAIWEKLALQHTAKSTLVQNGLTFTQHADGDWATIAIYPDILFEGPKQFLQKWAEQLVQHTSEAYRQWASSSRPQFVVRPDPVGFDPIFQGLLKKSKGESATSTAPTTTATSSSISTTSTTTTTKPSKKSGSKEKRQWHDGNAKVTPQAMAALDCNDQDEEGENGMERALAEAKATYLPTQDDLKEEQQQQSEAKPWGSSITSLLQQLTGQKVLDETDLQKPLQDLEQLLVRKNVASEVAHELAEGVRSKLKGKKLNSLYRVQTAVQQALEDSLKPMLQASQQVDLLRNVYGQRRGGLLSSRRPYVIVVVGINGVGKSTSLAKLAYHFSTNDCQPLLVAGDTFRSGAVEQLQVHGRCLNVPVFAQGYSKDPSAVAKAAIAHAKEQGNDVVLIDTAGRMQNNQPLMQALSKLVRENQPDFCLLVAEALVGHDGLDQFRMFQQAIMGPQRRGGMDGLLLTKFDTVSDKVGAALTLTHQTQTPIVFCGTGQKYHHLQKLSAPSIIQSLMAS